jgi:transposase-like protein
VPKPFPKGFRADVIAVARKGDQSVAQVARSFGVSGSCLARWLKIADREDGLAGGSPPTAGQRIVEGLAKPVMTYS